MFKHLKCVTFRIREPIGFKARVSFIGYVTLDLGLANYNP